MNAPITKEYMRGGKSHRRGGRKKKKVFPKMVVLILLLIGIYWGGQWLFSGGLDLLFRTIADRQGSIATFAQMDMEERSQYPEKLIELYEKNPDAREFVLGYPDNKDKTFTIDLQEYAKTDEVPLLMQWDQRWGYTEYAGNLFGLSGCGPTCLSMAAIYLTGDVSLSPRAMADFATENGYASAGHGTQWTLFSEGAKKLGLDVTEIPLDEQRILDNLKVDNPIVCIMGPGDFTDEGHFVVLCGYEDGKIKINDPNSYRNSEKLWEYDELAGQIRNLWVLRA